MIVEPSEVDLQRRSDRDRALVEAHCQGDTRAFTQIVADHYRILLVQAERRLGDRGQAEDAVQETFERAFRAMCRFGTAGEYRLGAWLSRILLNVCSDHSVRRANERGLPERMAVREVPVADVGDNLSDPQILQIVRTAIHALPSAQRDTFLLKEIDGLSYPQIADRLEISEESARARVHRARAALRRSLALTRAMFSAAIAAPLALRSLLRRTREYPTTANAAGASGASSEVAAGPVQTVAVHVAASPVGQTVISFAPSSAFRGSVLAGIAGLAVSGALAIPVVTAGDSGTSHNEVATQSVDASGTGVSATSTSVPTTDGGGGRSAVAAASTSEPEHPSAGSGTSVPWWSSFAAVLGFADPQSGQLPEVAPVPAQCAGSAAPDAASLATAARRVVSTLDLPSAAISPAGDTFTFAPTAYLAAGDQAQLAGHGVACLPKSGGTLDVDLVSGGVTVHLGGRLVYASGATYLFVGEATRADGSLPWETRPSFVAKLVVSSDANGDWAQLSVAFVDDAADSTGQSEPYVIGTTNGAALPPSTPPSTTEPPTTPPPSTTEPPTTTGPPSTTVPESGDASSSSGSPAAP